MGTIKFRVRTQRRICGVIIILYNAPRNRDKRTRIKSDRLSDGQIQYYSREVYTESSPGDSRTSVNECEYSIG